jgi:integrase
MKKQLPKYMHLSHGTYFFVKRKGSKIVWRPLGADFQTALKAHSKLLGGPTGGMAKLIDRVMEHIRPRLKPSTIQQYESVIRVLKRKLADFEPDQVKPRTIAELKVSMIDTPNFCNRALSVLRVVFNHALEWGLVESNPVIGIMRHHEHKRSRYLSNAERAAIRAAAGPRLKVIIDLLYLTGQRVSDVLKIRRADLTDVGIEFQQQKTGTKLTVAWTPELKAAVEAAKSLDGNVAAFTLLRNRRGKAPDYRSVQEQWTRACEAAGVADSHLHDLRAASITDVTRMGFDAQALAGHSSAQMTKRYVRLRESPVVRGPSR